MKISVILPTHNRSQFLEYALTALAFQTMSRNDFEVIVVDDGSTDNTAEVVAQDYSYNLIYLRQLNQGSAAARNTGALQSQGEILVFIDDDILVEPEYLVGLAEIHDRYEKIVGMGTCFTYCPSKDTSFSKIYSDVYNPKARDRRSSFVGFVECKTNNLSILKQDFLAVGMMHDVAGDGPTWWGDVEFGYRGMMAGFNFVQSGKAVCYHMDYSIQDMDGYTNRLQRASQMAALLFEKHPALLQELPMFADKTAISIRRDAPSVILNKVWHLFTSRQVVLKLMQSSAQLMEALAPNPKMLTPLYRWITSAYIYKGFRTGARVHTRSKVT